MRPCKRAGVFYRLAHQKTMTYTLLQPHIPPSLSLSPPRLFGVFVARPADATFVRLQNLPCWSVSSNHRYWPGGQHSTRLVPFGIPPSLPPPLPLLLWRILRVSTNQPTTELAAAAQKASAAGAGIVSRCCWMGTGGVYTGRDRDTRTKRVVTYDGQKRTTKAHKQVRLRPMI